MNRIVLIVIMIFMAFSPCHGMNRLTSYPYISGDTFRDFSDYIFDETKNSIIPKKVKYGDIIFVKTDFLQMFFKFFHPHIANPYILITHNSDLSVPREFSHHLYDEKIIAWFGQNVENFEHPKLHPLPIGLANAHWPHGSVNIFATVQNLTQQVPRDVLLYMNFAVNTNPAVREPIFRLFRDKSFCYVTGVKDLYSYLIDLTASKFVLSPRGNGLDCHRTWEALLMGATPIVISSSIDRLYNGLPVIIIDDWNEISEEFLNRTWMEMQGKEYHYERLYADYWFDLISSFKKNVPFKN